MKCLIVDPLHPSIHELLGNTQLAYDYEPDITREEIKDRLKDYDGLLIRSKTKVDQDLLSEAVKLKFVARAGAGVDNLDEAYLKAHNIAIINAPEGNRDALGEHVVGLILNLLNKISVADKQVRQGLWYREDNRGEELSAKTVGLIGYGNMGRATAKRLAAFGCKILAYDKYLHNYGDAFVEEATLSRLHNEVDILSLHIPLTAETKGMVNQAFFEKFKNDLIFINAARGEIVPNHDLVQLMKLGKISKAALDVLENEHLNELSVSQQADFAWLTQSERTIFTPHVGGWSVESYERINQILVNKIQLFLEKFNIN
jgi:D-3-phosphoglycerate dehydrogenase